MLRLGRDTAVALLAALVVAGSADAATLRGTVVAPPATHGRTVVVPVLRADGRAIKAVLPASGAIRAPIGRLKATQLRFGDAVTLRGSRLTGLRPHARTLTVGKRGPTLTFAAISARRTAAIANVQKAADTVLALPQQTAQITAKTDVLPAEVRAQLRDIRTDVNYTIADLRDQAGALEAVAAAAAPVQRGRAGYLDTLKAEAAGARTAADKLDESVGQLDEAINAVGPDSLFPSLPINAVGAVSDVLHAVLDLLRGQG